MDEWTKANMQNEIEQAKHKQRMHQGWDDLIGDIIQEGVERGLFDNLKGKGKPLNLRENHFEADQALAHSIMKDNDVPPAWIMERNQILEEQATLRAEVLRKWAWHEAKFAAAQTANTRDRLTLSWDDACLKWKGQIEQLNKRIVTYNLKRPSANLEIFKLNLDDELKRAHAPRWLR